MISFEKLINFNQTEHFLTLSFQNITKHVEQFIVQFELKFAKLKFSSALLEKIPSFVCLVFKIENK